jgi:hypoxanthine-DNA glycosylase
VATRHRGFPPIAAPDARALILGSLPGALSLARGEYYAQPRNTFWRIAGELFGFDPAGTYAERVEALKANRIALWDVCAAAERAGSLDSAIRAATANDFDRFLGDHPHIRLIAFNGATAANLYSRIVSPRLSANFSVIAQCALPSTSPAHAEMAYQEKLARWRVICETA